MTINIKPVTFPYPPGLAQDYFEVFQRVEHLYEYNPWVEIAYQERLEYLKKHYGADRSVVAQTLLTYNQNLGAGQKTLDNISLFAQGAEVVITGQQAGVFTGPLYTIYKAITTINMARDLSNQFNQPIVPIFWIAAEDHDFNEVNHTFVLNKANQLEKLVLELYETGRKSVGDLWDKAAVAELIEQLGNTLVETEFTKTLIDFLSQEAEKATNLADWFGRIMLWLFKEQGLIMANPTDEVFRRVESPLFESIIANNQKLAEALLVGTRAVQALGYHPQVELADNHANLFIYTEGERRALYRLQDGYYGTREGDHSWSREELIELCQKHPNNLSTNVVTRPLAQEKLFPVLAYVAGPGEIAYYGLYKQVYRLFDYKMPVIYPRMNATLLEPGVKRLTDKYQLEFSAITGGLQAKLHEALTAADEVGIEQSTDQARQSIRKAYDQLIPQLKRIDSGLEKLGQENLERVLNQLDFLANKAQQKHRQNSEGLVKHFHRIEVALLPNGNRQERVVNVIPYLNKFGPDLITQLVNLTTNVERDHLLIEIS